MNIKCFLIGTLLQFVNVMILFLWVQILIKFNTNIPSCFFFGLQNYAVVLHVVVVDVVDVVVVVHIMLLLLVRFCLVWFSIFCRFHCLCFNCFIFNAGCPCLVFVFHLLLLLFSLVLVVANKAIDIVVNWNFTTTSNKMVFKKRLYLLALHMRHPVDQTAEQTVLWRKSEIWSSWYTWRE